MTQKDSLEKLYRKIEKVAQETGAGLVGFADMSPLKGMPAGDESFFKLPFAVTFAVEIPKDAARASLKKPSEEMRSAYKMCNKTLKGIGEKVSQILAEEGYKARYVDPAQRVDPENLLGPISQKAIAMEAGIGWIGRSGLLLTDKYGPRQRMAAVLTDMPVTRKAPKVENKCGDCMECVDKCALKILKACDYEGFPACRDEVIDWEKCGKYETRLIGDGSKPEKACGRCIAVCPLSGLNA
ncbi:MAG: epoxyqueuosine reductase [Thermoplasmatales archaeon]|nr:epoxyqueuosine reductase [Thermoplasmatales archaeon]